MSWGFSEKQVVHSDGVMEESPKGVLREGGGRGKRNHEGGRSILGRVCLPGLGLKGRGLGKRPENPALVEGSSQPMTAWPGKSQRINFCPGLPFLVAHLPVLLRRWTLARVRGQGSLICANQADQSLRSIPSTQKKKWVSSQYYPQ